MVFDKMAPITQITNGGIDESSFKYIFEVCVLAYTPP